MGTRIDITGQRFGRLVALHFSGYDPERGNAYWLFQCDCGKKHEALGRHVRKGMTRSCGCARSESLTARNKAKATIMTRKHFEKLAKALASVRGELDVRSFELLLERVGEVCTEANPAFNQQQFVATAKAEPFVKHHFGEVKQL